MYQPVAAFMSSDRHAGRDAEKSEHFGRLARSVAGAILGGASRVVRDGAQITPSGRPPSFLPSGSVTEMYCPPFSSLRSG